MKKKILVLCFIVASLQALNIAMCDDPPTQDELMFQNRTSFSVTARIYPVSMIMNGLSQYSLIARKQLVNPPVREFNYNAGVRIDTGNKRLAFPVAGTPGFNYDNEVGPNNLCLGSFGRGVYKIVFTWHTGFVYLSDTTLYEQDAGDNYDITFILVDSTENFGGPGGIGITYFSYLIGGGVGPEKWVGLSNRHINCWDPYPYIDTLPRRSKDFGNILYDNGDEDLDNPYIIIPQDSREDCDLPEYPDQNQEFEDNRSGILTLNMTIDKNISTRDILENNPTNIVVTKHAKLYLGSSRTIDMITPTVPSGGYTNLIIQDSALLLLRANSEVIVRSPNRLNLEQGGQITMFPNSKIRFKAGSLFCNQGKVKGSGGIVFEKGYHQYNCSQLVESVFEDSTKFELADSAEVVIPDGQTIKLNGSQTGLLLGIKSKLRLGDNSKLIFEGADCYLNAKSTSSILFGDSASIVFKNGAYIRANGVTFDGDSSSDVWNGITLENSGLDSIQNCTFSKARTSITIKNDSVSFANNNNNIIIGNTFNSAQANGRGINANNVFNMLLENNSFNVSGGEKTFGVYFRNTINGSSYSLNIIKNVFSGGYIPLYLSCLAADKTPFYVAKNEFYGNGVYSMVCQKTTGDIKYNIFDIYNTGSAMGLWNCNANIFGNTIYSISLNMYLNYSYPVISPTRDQYDNTIWTGGRNDFYADENENILMTNSLPSLNMGKNMFTINTNYPDHILGSIPDTNLLQMKYNCWYNPYDSAKFNFFKNYEDSIKNISAIYLPKWCSPYLDQQTPIVENKGNGVYDTVEVTDDILEAIDDDEALLIQARSDYRRHYYSDAVTTYKGLINNFQTSSYLFTSLSELYDCYDALDTSGNETTTYVLYGDLRDYLEDRILSNEYDTTFEDVAFESVLMCETLMEEFEYALTGYEFLALYHPDAEQRLLASWDYEDINELLGEGSGWSQSAIDELVGTDEQEGLAEFREYKRLNKKINDDPLLKRMKKRYEKMAANNEKHLKAIEKSQLPEKLISMKKQQQNERLISRAKDNVMRGRYLNKAEKETRRLEDMRILFSEGQMNLQTDNIETSQPNEFKLSQNFPNPFNPTTKINFSIPKHGLITLKVYDVLGKEIITLVNDQKPAGNYEVEFNGSNLPSGVYFYRIESGEFRDVKRMVLIK